MVRTRKQQPDNDIFGTRRSSLILRPQTAPPRVVRPPWATDSPPVQKEQLSIISDSANASPATPSGSPATAANTSITVPPLRITKDDGVTAAGLPSARSRPSSGAHLYSPDGDIRPLSARRAPVDDGPRYGQYDEQTLVRRTPGYIPHKKRASPPRQKEARQGLAKVQLERSPREQKILDKRAFGYLPVRHTQPLEPSPRTITQLESMAAGHISRKKRIDVKHESCERDTAGYIPRLGHHQAASEFSPFNLPPHEDRRMKKLSPRPTEDHLETTLTPRALSDRNTFRLERPASVVGKRHVQPAEHQPRLRREREELQKGGRAPFWR